MTARRASRRTSHGPPRRAAGDGLNPYREIIRVAAKILAAKTLVAEISAAEIFLGREGHGLDHGRQ
jgi:hypothetical protein